MSRFFVQLIKCVNEKENIFTECLTATLQHDPELARRLVRKLCGEKLDSLNIGTVLIDVATQRSFPRTTNVRACCVDMVVTLDGATTIGIENKLFADEGVDQLRRYLKLGLSRIACIRAKDANVAEDVRSDPRYLKPKERQHHLWPDFYIAVEQCAARSSSPLLTAALLELFQFYGFEPPKPEIGDLTHPDPKVREQKRENFAKLWDSTRSELAKMGWKRITRGSIAELFVEDGSSKWVKRAWLDPTWGRGLLRVRLMPHPGTQSELEEALRAAALPHRDDLDIQSGQEGRRIRDKEYVQVAISLRRLLGEATDSDVMKKLLAEFVSGVFRAAG